MEGTGELEFEQAYNEVVSCLNASSLFEKEPKYKKVLSVISIPQRVIQFRVSWENDNGVQETTVGYRVQFNNALGPFKGGLRFHPSVNLSILKFLGFEQIFKNALTNQPIGGGKGGLRVDLKGRSDSEVRKICYAFMTELSRHIGQDIDVPAGDIGVGKREIGYMFGAFRTFRNSWEGSLTGKGLDWGGSLIRPEATGYGLIYFLCEMIKLATHDTESLSGKRVIVSGSGNVAQYAALKAIELGATVLSLSDSKGSLIFKKGATVDQMHVVAKAKLNSQALKDILSTEEFVNADVEYVEGARPWAHAGNADIALPCATENEVSGDEAELLLEKGVRYVAEGSNMGSTMEAIDVFERSRTSAKSKEDPYIFYAPGKASNLGGVLVSALEMAQNSQRIPWSSADVDGELMKGMKNAFKVSVETAKAYSKEHEDVILPSIVLGANLAGFIKVADAMFEQGDVF